LGGHATLVCADDTIGAGIDVFLPLDPQNGADFGENRSALSIR